MTNPELVRHFFIRICGMFALVTLFLNVSWGASNGKVLYSFTGAADGGDPASQLSFDSSGNAYGTTVVGGDFDCGTIFQLTPMSGSFRLSTLFSFDCGQSGKNPYGGVTLDSKGNLYGTTVAGGNAGICAGDGCGVVYQLLKSGSTWTENVLYNFTGGDDGFGPGSGVVFDNVGNLFGMTPDGGANAAGVVYELSPHRGGGLWDQTVIHAFTGGADGAVGSLGPLLYAGGKFYGVTEIAGAFGAGTAFVLSSDAGGAWHFATIHQFEGQPHAGFPYGGLITDGKGALYGTTYFGGANGMGTVYRLNQGNGKAKETVLHNFAGGTDGSFPTSTLVFDAAGNLYGTTSTGGLPACDCGTVFEFSRSGGGLNEHILHAFTSTPDGAYPSYGLTPDSKGNLYGTTPVGGTHAVGLVFGFTP